MLLGKDLSEATLNEFSTDAGRNAYFPKSVTGEGTDFFNFSITGLDETSCLQLKATAGGTIRHVNCRSEGGDSYTADMLYHKDLSPTDGEVPEGVVSTGGSGNATTRSFDDDREKCEESGYQYCTNKTCITLDEICPTGSASCAQYPKTSENNTGGKAGKNEKGVMCRCPAEKIYRADDNKCIPACSGHGNLTAIESCDCHPGFTGEVCETECSGNGKVKNGQCVCNLHYRGELCETWFKCASGTLNEDNTCSCDEGWFGALCDQECSDTRKIISTPEECGQCSNREILTVDSENYCVLKCSNNQFHTVSGGCTSCSDNTTTTSSITSTDVECAKCTNREIIEVNSKKLCMKRCTDNSYFHNTSGSCYACSSNSSVLSTTTECSKCGDKRTILESGTNKYCILNNCGTGSFRDKNGGCYTCSHSSTISSTSEECGRCYNTENPRALGKNNYCYSCSTTTSFEATPEECSKCGNTRTTFTSNNKTYCILNNCGEKTFRNSNGTCYACSTSSFVSVTNSEECSRCTNTSNPRFLSGNNCVLCSYAMAVSASDEECAKCTNREMITMNSKKTCVQKCSANNFHNERGDCYSCSSTYSVSTSPEECHKCSANGNERFMSSYGSCYACSVSDSIPSTQEECDQCKGTRKMLNGSCVKVSNTTSVSSCTNQQDNTICDLSENSYGICNNGECKERSCTPECTWTEWFDVDYPKYEEGGGDFETYEKIRAAGGAVCEHPQEIKCEAENYPGLQLEQVGQRVHCDVRFGLVCRNEEQPGLFKMCMNYRMRVLCCDDGHCNQ